MKVVTNCGANALVTPSRGTVKVATNHGANALVTPSRGAMKVTAVRSSNDSVTMMHRRENQILPSMKHFPR